jgi:hypothetical protein
MVRMVRLLIALLTALLLALPGFGGCGGGGGGGGDSTGVWILPRSSQLGTMPPSSVTTPRGTTNYPGFSTSITLKVAAEVIRPTAALINPLTNQLMALPVAGDVVTIPASVLTNFASLGITTASGYIVGANGRGYYFRLRLDLVQRVVALEIF